MDDCLRLPAAARACATMDALLSELGVNGSVVMVLGDVVHVRSSCASNPATEMLPRENGFLRGLVRMRVASACPGAMGDMGGEGRWEGAAGGSSGIMVMKIVAKEKWR